MVTAMVASMPVGSTLSPCRREIRLERAGPADDLPGPFHQIRRKNDSIGVTGIIAAIQVQSGLTGLLILPPPTPAVQINPPSRGGIVPPKTVGLIENPIELALVHPAIPMVSLEIAVMAELPSRGTMPVKPLGLTFPAVQLFDIGNGGVGQVTQNLPPGRLDLVICFQGFFVSGSSGRLWNIRNLQKRQCF